MATEPDLGELMRTGPRRVVVAGAMTIVVLGLLLVVAWLWLNRDTSTYADGFSESSFSQVEEGMPYEEVHALVGSPLSVDAEPVLETWYYFTDQPGQQEDGTWIFDLFGPLGKVRFDDQGRVVSYSGEGTDQLRVGLSKEEVRRLLGSPSNARPARSKLLHYSSPGNAGVYRARMVELDEDDRVSRVIRYTTHD